VKATLEISHDGPQRLAVSLSTLAQMLDASRSSVRRWLGEAGIRPIAVGQGAKGAIRYRWSEVEAWLESRESLK
jgi:predicted DNA-binding transcriptional regulator AlpA